MCFFWVLLEQAGWWRWCDATALPSASVASPTPPTPPHPSLPHPCLAPAVLIDEAGQASEVAALQPLVFGAKRWVAGVGVCGRREVRGAAPAQPTRDCPTHTEIALLLALLPATCSVVLVGDPQQLPATILSELAKQVRAGAGLLRGLLHTCVPPALAPPMVVLHNLPGCQRLASRYLLGLRCCPVPGVSAKGAKALLLSPLRRVAPQTP